jgi:C4-dicarboxylate-specific signal transduction histidine kinase
VQTHALHRVEILELAATGMTAMSLAHDLEAALDEAASETGVLARSTGIREDLRDSLGHLVALFKSLRTLVSDIKPGPAKTRRRKSTFDVAELLDQLTTFYQPRLDRDHIRVAVTCKPSGKAFRVKAVEGHVRQILDNLYRNAMYWLVDTQEKHPKDVEKLLIQLALDHRSKTLSFSDTGVGIAPHDTEWIFEPFTTHREGGYGLGLYISKELCKFNGITIMVDPRSLNQWRRHERIILDFSECYVESDK